MMWSRNFKTKEELQSTKIFDFESLIQKGGDAVNNFDVIPCQDNVVNINKKSSSGITIEA